MKAIEKKKKKGYIIPQTKEKRARLRRQNTKASLLKLTPEENEKRLKDKRENTKSSLLKLTSEENEKRLEDKRENTKSSRAKETPDNIKVYTFTKLSISIDLDKLIILSLLLNHLYDIYVLSK